jgi:hypothetical protein
MERLNVKAGVVGLTTVLRLAEARHKNVLVSTKHMPVDSGCCLYKSMGGC